ncbi:MAG: ABC transporter permease [Bacilli bacterium]|nr:ABC transporter permease [Bacilli bacterium]
MRRVDLIKRIIKIACAVCVLAGIVVGSILGTKGDFLDSLLKGTLIGLIPAAIYAIYSLIHNGIINHKKDKERKARSAVKATAPKVVLPEGTKPEEIDPSLFAKSGNEDLHDQAFETKPVSYLMDCVKRFAKNKASIVAAAIIAVIALYAIIVPMASPRAYVNKIEYPTGFRDDHFSYVLPYNQMFAGSGFWDGTKKENKSETDYIIAINDDSNHNPVVQFYEKVVTKVGAGTSTSYKIRRDTYAVGAQLVKLNQAGYDKLVSYNDSLPDDKKMMRPIVDSQKYISEYKVELENEMASKPDTDLTPAIISDIVDKLTSYYNQNSNVWFKMTATKKNGTHSSNTFRPVLSNDKDLNSVESIYMKDSSDNYVYFENHGGEYTVRVDYFDYFSYKNGFTPYYFFGSNSSGQDIFLRLAQGTRFSLLLGIGISAINLIIGLVWGAVSGYYGGTVDLVMERVTDIISTIPSLIILTICSIQFTNNAALKAALGDGIVVLAFLVAFVYNGWIGVAGTTRMQFYRFKGQEYVLASRSLGAKDTRLIFRHILPNAIGTLVTSTVLMIPGVIFGESSLSYLGIINFSTSGLVSIGSLLSEGQTAGLQYNPHVLLFPCLIISLLEISFNLFGNGLRDAFNTTLKGSD